MNKSLLAAIVLVVVGSITAYAISPYFTESTIDEAIPVGAINQKIMEEETMMGETMMGETMMGETMMGETMMGETMMEKEIPITYSGTFVGVGDGIHDAQGNTYTIPLEDGSTVLRLENFESTNGPDLYVYLSTDENASEFVNLGELKANRGSQNYNIPDGTDLSKYSNVLIWCKTFGVLFGSAELSSQ
ncbi:DM13 domain-containing protein [Nitrosopumilus sp. S4]